MGRLPATLNIGTRYRLGSHALQVRQRTDRWGQRPRPGDSPDGVRTRLWGVFISTAFRSSQPAVATSR